MAYFATSSQIGVDLNNGSATALFAVGTHVLGSAGTEWVYVQANTSINAYTVCAFDSASYTCGMASGGDLTLGSSLAVAQTSISNSAYGWVAIRGMGLQIQQTGTSSVQNLTLYLAASAVPTGVLSNQITASNTVQGISLLATASATYGFFNLTWPRGVITQGL